MLMLYDFSEWLAQPAVAREWAGTRVEHLRRVGEAARNATLDEVLRGLRSENDSTQLRAIIASVEELHSKKEG